MPGMKFISDSDPQFGVTDQRLAAQLVCHYGPGNVQVNTGFKTFFSVPLIACAAVGPPPFTSMGRVITCPGPDDDWVAWYVRSGDVAALSYPGCQLDDVLASPADLVPGEVTGSSARLAWGPVMGATGYAVEYRGPSGDWLPMSPNPVVPRTTVNGLQPGTDYTFRVRAIGGVCSLDSLWSSINIKTIT